MGKIDQLEETAGKVKLKILIVQPTGDKPGHFEIHTTYMAQELAKMGHTVTVTTNQLNPQRHLKGKVLFRLHQDDSRKYSFVDLENNRKSDPLSYWLGYYRNSWFFLRRGFELAKADSYDAAYVTDVEFLVATILCKLYRKTLPAIVMQVNASNFSFADYPGSIIKKIYKAFQAFCFRSVIGKEIAAFSVLGEWHISRLRQQLKIPKKFPIALIPDGSNPEYQKENRATARSKLGIDPDLCVFLFLGVLRKEKGLATLASAFHILEKKGHKAGLVLAGSPFDYSDKEIKELFAFGLSEGWLIHQKLNFIPEEEMPLYFGAADCFLMPYEKTYNASSGPLFKGVCTYGVPVICSEVGEMGVLVKRHDLGLLCEPGNAGSLALAMERFLESSVDQWSRWSANAKRVSKENSWESLAKRYDLLFNQLLQNRASQLEACTKN